MRNPLVFLAILLCCLINASAQSQISAEEYKVYGDWLKGWVIITETRQVLIMDSTGVAPGDFEDMPKHRRKKFTRLDRSTLKDYRLKNREAVALQNKFNIATDVRFLTFDEFQFFLESYAAAETFAKEFGADDRITLSRVGFSKNGTQALLHVNYKSNVIRHFDRGYYFVLSKAKDKWAVKQWGKSWEY